MHLGFAPYETNCGISYGQYTLMKTDTIRHCDIGNTRASLTKCDSLQPGRIQLTSSVMEDKARHDCLVWNMRGVLHSNPGGSPSLHSLGPRWDTWTIHVSNEADLGASGLNYFTQHEASPNALNSPHIERSHFDQPIKHLAPLFNFHTTPHTNLCTSHSSLHLSLNTPLVGII